MLCYLLPKSSMRWIACARYSLGPRDSVYPMTSPSKLAWCMDVHLVASRSKKTFCSKLSMSKQYKSPCVTLYFSSPVAQVWAGCETVWSRAALFPLPARLPALHQRHVYVRPTFANSTRSNNACANYGTHRFPHFRRTASCQHRSACWNRGERSLQHNWRLATHLWLISLII